MTSNNNNNSYCISVKNLVKTYHSSISKRNVIDDISFDIDYGTVFGFLGPNGAGKTTTIKILTGILQPTQGSIKILDKEINKNMVQQKRLILHYKIPFQKIYAIIFKNYRQIQLILRI